MDHRQRAVGGRVHRSSRGPARPGRPRPEKRGPGGPPPAARPRPGGRRVPLERADRRDRDHASTSIPVDPASDREPTSARPCCSTVTSIAGSWTRSSGQLPGRPASTTTRRTARTSGHPAGDLEAIARPIDFLGVNYYFREPVSAPRADGLALARRAQRGRRRADRDGLGRRPYGPVGTCSPGCATDYRAIPIYVTENGIAPRRRARHRWRGR